MNTKSIPSALEESLALAVRLIKATPVDVRDISESVWKDILQLAPPHLLQMAGVEPKIPDTIITARNGQYCITSIAKDGWFDQVFPNSLRRSSLNNGMIYLQIDKENIEHSHVRWFHRLVTVDSENFEDEYTANYEAGHYLVFIYGDCGRMVVLPNGSVRRLDRRISKDLVKPNPSANQAVL